MDASQRESQVLKRQQATPDADSLAQELETP